MSDSVFALNFIAGSIISLVVISNPLSTSAIFLALTDGMSKDEKSKIVKKSIRYSTMILIFFSLTGLLLFQIFGFSVGAFRMAGGILLFTTAIGMLNPPPREKEARDTSRDIALIPLSIPFTSGPGTIVTTVVLMSEAQNVIGTHDPATGSLCILGVYLGILAILIFSYFMMMRSEKIDHILREGGRKVMTKLMGLLVMAIAIQFIINGIKDVLPEFLEIVDEARQALSILLPF